MLKYLREEGQSDRDWMQEWISRIGNPRSTEIEGWFSIETAPRDIFPVLVRDGKWQPFIATFVKRDLGGFWCFEQEVSFDPTLWQPLSAHPPKVKEG